MTTVRVTEALALIPENKAKLDAVDDLLRATIRHVEDVLNELRPGVPAAVDYSGNGPLRILLFQSARDRWIIARADADVDVDVPLLSASREVRAEVFRPDLEGLSPIERLIIKIAGALQAEGSARSPLLDVAKRLTAALTEAGFPPP